MVSASFCPSPSRKKKVKNGLPAGALPIIFELHLKRGMSNRKPNIQKQLPRIRAVQLGEEEQRGRRVFSLRLVLKSGPAEPFTKSHEPADLLDDYAAVLKRYPYLQTDWKLLGALQKANEELHTLQNQTPQ